MIAARLPDSPELLEQARDRVRGWLAEGPGTRPYAEAWHELLSNELPTIIETIAEDSERARALRQCTPFAGAIDPRERWRLWAQVREELEQR